MKDNNTKSNAWLRAVFVTAVAGLTMTTATATEPCGDFGECKVLIEVNTTDGDIGLHFLVDGADLVKVEGKNPDGKKFYKADAKKELREQFFTESFVESAEPVCRAELAEEEGDDVVTLEEFLERWEPGTYSFKGKGDEGEKSHGATELTHELPAAPTALVFDDMTGVISWAAGDDLGECATNAELDALVLEGVLAVHPEDVAVAAWEVVFEPDVDDGDPLGKLKFVIRLSGDADDFSPLAVSVPEEYLDSLPDDTLAKIEIGAIGGEDNASFTELFDVCVNEDEGCEDD